MASHPSAALLPAAPVTPHDALRSGPSSSAAFQVSFAASTSASATALRAAEADHPRARSDARVARVRDLSGVGAAMRAATDLKRAEQFHRAPGLASSFLGRDAASGDLRTLGVHDVYGDRDDAVALQCDALATLMAVSASGSSAVV